MYNHDFQRSTLKLLATNLAFSQDFEHLLLPEYYETSSLKLILKLIKEHHALYNTEVTPSDLMITLDDYASANSLSKDARENIKIEIKHVFSACISSENYVKDTLLKFCRRQALKNSIMESLDILEKDGNYETILKSIDSAISIGMNTKKTEFQFSGFSALQRIYNEVYNQKNLVPTGFREFDNALMGGMGPGELHVFVAPPKTGKSTLACNIGFNALKQNKVVFHITLEIKNFDVAMKYLQRASCMTIKDILSLDSFAYQETVHRHMGQFNPKLFINYFTMNTVNTLNIRSWICKVRSETGLTPDLIIVDYDDCLEPTNHVQDNMYLESGGIYADLIALGDYFQCFTGDTKISLVDGTEKELKDIKKGEEFYVYSSDHEGKISVEKAYGLGCLGTTKELLEIELDNHEKIKCTLDHQFMMRDGSFKEAQNLIEGESLMPLYRVVNENGYRKIKDNKTSKFKLEHSLVAKSHVPGIKECRDKIDDSDKTTKLVIHHKNFNKLDNSPSNLEWMGRNEHWKYHASLGRIKNFNEKLSPEERKKHASNAAKKSWESEKNREEHKKISSNVIRKLQSDPSFQERHSNRTKERWKDISYKEKMITLLKNRNNDPVYKEKLKNRMSIMSKEFWTDPLYREKKISESKKRWDSEEYKKRMKKISSETSKKNWSNPDYKMNHSKKMLKAWENPSFKEKFLKSRIINHIKKLVNSNIEITKENYNKTRKRLPKWDTAIRIFGNEQLLLKSAINNHRIISIKKIETSDEKVYCINVPAKGNFALSAGVFVKNCPILTFAQPKREAWDKPERSETIYANDLAHSALKAHRAYSISSLNFKKGENKGYIYMDMVRRGESYIKVPLIRDLSKSIFQDASY